MNKDAMNQGVQILLDRMDTNPEEFEYDIARGGGKWSDIVQAVHARKNAPEAHKNTLAPLPFLTDPEVNALYDKLEDVRRENFTADVLRRLADDSVKQQELWANVSAYSTSNHPLLGTPPSLTIGTGTGIGAWGTSSITHAQTLSLSEREKQQLCKALEDYDDKINLKEHEKLHKAFGLAVKAEAVKAERKKAVK
jgi:hypothetical protein